MNNEYLCLEDFMNKEKERIIKKTENKIGKLKKKMRAEKEQKIKKNGKDRRE